MIRIAPAAPAVRAFFMPGWRPIPAGKMWAGGSGDPAWTLLLLFYFLYFQPAVPQPGDA